MNELVIIIGAAARNELRWARQHLYYLLILAPLVTGFALVTVDQAAGQIPPFRPGQKTFFAAVVLVFLALFAAGLSRAAAEIYHNRRPESVFESFPVRTSSHFWFALVIRFWRAAAIMVVVLAARWRWTGDKPGAWVVVGSLFLAFIVAVTEIICGLTWIHWNHLAHRLSLAGAAFCALVSAGMAGDLIGKLFLPYEFAAYRMPLFSGIELAWGLVLLFIAIKLHQRWRVRDIEFALRLGHRSTINSGRVTRLTDKFGAVVGALVRRDLALVRRVFSSAVYVSATLTGFILLLLATVLWSGILPQFPNPYGFLGGTWLVPVLAVKAACVVGCLAVIAIVPVLVSHQLRHLWLERTAGARGSDVFLAKLYLARWITFPLPLLFWAVAAAVGAVPAFYLVPLLFECIWLWWMLTTIVGSLVYEIPDRPGLSLVLLVLVGMGLGLFIAWLWPVGIVAYVFGAIRTLRERGMSRAGYCLLVGES